MTTESPDADVGSMTTRRSPTGAQLVLAHDDYRAVITEVGATLRSLTWQQRPLIRGFGDDELPPAYSGAVLAPWPNRIADGRYTFGGRTLGVPINEPERNTALHGLVHDRPWHITTVSTSEAHLQHRIWPTAGYPWMLDLDIRYHLGPHGLTIELTAHNASADTAPYGCSFHPYLVAGAGTIDDWTLEVEAASVLTVDPQRLLPLRLQPVTEFDFRIETRLTDLVIDHAFTDIAIHDDVGRLRLRTQDGTGTELRWTPRTPWLQLCTGDRPEPALDRTGLAAEPMTCPPDAFNSGTDLVRLDAGRTHTTHIEIGALTA